jgi:hypothetical protein
MKDFVTLENDREYVRFSFMKSTLFWDVMPCSPSHNSLLFASYFPGLLFHPEHGGSVVLWNITELLPGYTSLPRRVLFIVTVVRNSLTRFSSFNIQLSVSIAFCLVACRYCQLPHPQRINVATALDSGSLCCCVTA